MPARCWQRCCRLTWNPSPLTKVSVLKPVFQKSKPQSWSTELLGPLELRFESWCQFWLTVWPLVSGLVSLSFWFAIWHKRPEKHSVSRRWVGQGIRQVMVSMDHSNENSLLSSHQGKKGREHFVSHTPPPLAVKWGRPVSKGFLFWHLILNPWADIWDLAFTHLRWMSREYKHLVSAGSHWMELRGRTDRGPGP